MNQIDNYLKQLQESKKPPEKIEIDPKVKKLNINMLPPDLKKIALTWPLIIKKKINFIHPATNNGKIFSANDIKEVHIEQFIYSLEYNQMNDFMHSGPEWMNIRNSNIEITNNKLLFCFFIYDYHRNNGWCYSPVDKHVYAYFGHDENTGLQNKYGKPILSKPILKLPYKQWISLWKKVSILKAPHSIYYGNEPDFGMKDCINYKKGSIDKRCKPFKRMS